MRILLKVIGFTFLIVLLGTSCTKISQHDELAIADEGFNQATIKEWYYAVFKKSAEWKSSLEAGKKLPKWNYPTYRKVGNIEIIEFPLARLHYRGYITQNAAATNADRKRIAESVIGTIVFIKTPKGKIEVREMEYVPNWEYLKAKNFDISNNTLAKSNDFTGRVTVKTWGGSTVNIRKFKDGKNVGSYRLEKRNTNATNGEVNSIDLPTAIDPNCTYELTCTWEEVCTTTGTGDNMVTTCVIENLECDFDNVVLISCDDDDGGSQCDPSIDEPCECQLYGINCGGNGGTGNGDPDPDPGVDVSREREYDVYNSFGGPSPNNIWKIVGHATITGKKFNDASQNYFTNSSPNSAEFKSTNMAITHWPLSSWYAIFTDFGGTGTLVNNNKGARVTHSTTVSYPNQGNQTHLHNGEHTWPATGL